MTPPVRLRTRHTLCAAAAALLLLGGGSARAGEPERGPGVDPPTPQAHIPSVNDFGDVGLVQMPNGRFFDDGEMIMGYSRVAQYERGFLTIQGLPWLQGTLRYTNIRNRLYGPRDFSGDQTYKDRGVDLKFRLLEETDVLPALAVGLRDIGGTGLFASEYIAASKRWYDLDFTLGLAWGNAGSEGNIKNPFRYLSSYFDARTGSGGVQGGEVNTSFFQGERASVFWGLEYVTPLDGLRFKVELDTNSYQLEPQNNKFDVDFPINYAVQYSPFSWLDTAFGLERGNTLMWRLNLRTNLNKDAGMPKQDVPPHPVAPRPSPPRPVAETVSPPALASQAMRKGPADAVFDAVEAAGLEVTDVSFGEGEAQIRFIAEGKPPAERKLASAAMTLSRSSAAGPLRGVEFIATDRTGRALASSRFDIAELERSVALTGSPFAVARLPETNWRQAFAPAPADEPAFVETIFDAMDQAGLSPTELGVSGTDLTIGLSRGTDKATLERIVDVLGTRHPATIHSVSFTDPASGGVIASYALDSMTAGLAAPVAPRTVVATAADDWSADTVTAVAETVFQAIDAQGMTGVTFDMEGHTAWLAISQSKYIRPATAVGRAARVVAASAPPEIEEIAIVTTSAGVPVSTTRLMRKDLEKAVAGRGSIEEVFQHTRVEGGQYVWSDTSRTNWDHYPNFTWNIQPKLTQHVGGPDNFYFYQIWAQLRGELDVYPGASLRGSLGQDLINNLEELELESDSELPHVRSDVKNYLKSGTTWISDLTANYVFMPVQDVYARLSGGLLETMFAGVSTEVLYRPYDKPWAVGVDLNWVRQRGYDALFSFRDYSITTGHLSWYQQLPWYDITATLRVGRYLAGDVGATVELERTFDNGVTVGIFATKTNVSAAKFGEGGFDKGMYVSLPLDLFFTKPSATRGSFLFRPLTRDGGQRVVQPLPLYSVTGGQPKRDLVHTWDSLLD